MLSNINVNVNTLFITGHRPDKLGGYKPNKLQDWVKEELKVAFNTIKPKTIMTGMALGTDQWSAEVAIQCGIPFIAVVPFLGQDHIWPTEARNHYHSLLEEAQSVYIVTSGSYASWKLQKRNEYMVDNSQLGIAVWDGSTGGTANCVNYALSKNIPIVQINPRDLKYTAYRMKNLIGDKTVDPNSPIIGDVDLD